MSLRSLTYSQLFLLGLGLDQVSKRLFSSSAIVNTGISFSFFSAAPANVVLTFLVVFLAGAAYISFQSARRNSVLLVCHALFFSGALSNWLDRLFFGGVRDIWTLPVFGIQNNLADWLIVGAAVVAGSVIMRPDDHSV